MVLHSAEVEDTALIRRLGIDAAREPFWLPSKSVGYFFTSIPIAWSAFHSDRLQNTAKYLFRSLCMPSVTAAWLNVLFDKPLLQILMRRRPRLLFKIHRSYLTTAYQPLDRLAALCAHYGFLKTAARLFLQEIINAASNTITLSRLLSRRFPETGSYLLTLAITDLADREGEFLLALVQESGHKRIAILAFTITKNALNQAEISIGCLQGAAPPDGAATAKQTTLDLYRWRPKNLLLEALYAMADAWQIENIQGVSNRTRVCGSERLDHHHVSADYDAFWRECGGVVIDAGWYQLPRRLVHRTIEDIPSHRRSEFRKRIQLKAHVIRDIARTLRVPDGELASTHSCLSISAVAYLEKSVGLEKFEVRSNGPV